MALKLLKRLVTSVAKMQGLAGGGTECTGETCMVGAAKRTNNRLTIAGNQRSQMLLCRHGWRGDAVFPQFAFSFFRHPIGGPCRSNHGFNIKIVNVIFKQNLSDIVFNGTHGRTASECGCDDDFKSTITIFHTSQNTKISNG